MAKMEFSAADFYDSSAAIEELTDAGPGDATGSRGDARWRAEWERGRRAHPRVALSLAQFATHLDEIAGSKGAPAHVEDLYLACGCARALPAALEAFDALLTDVAAWIKHVSTSPDLVDEVRQQLRERLLLAPSPGARPRVAEYGGAGSLRAWLRVTAVRTALNLGRHRNERCTESIDQAEREHTLTALSPGPELRLLCASHQAALSRAMRDAFSWLPREERLALRMHYAARLTVERIARATRVDPATVKRRLSRARTNMRNETRRLLSERLRLSLSEVDGLIEVLRAGFDLSLTVLLRTLPPEGGAMVSGAAAP